MLGPHHSYRLIVSLRVDEGCSPDVPHVSPRVLIFRQEIHKASARLRSTHAARTIETRFGIAWACNDKQLIILCHYSAYGALFQCLSVYRVRSTFIGWVRKTIA